jgi:hypothetical protein
MSIKACYIKRLTDSEVWVREVWFVIACGGGKKIHRKIWWGVLWLPRKPRTKDEGRLWQTRLSVDPFGRYGPP